MLIDADVLDEFSKKAETPAKATTTATPSATGPGRPAEPALQNDEIFAKSLESGMQDLFGQLDANPEMQAEFEKMMQELIAAGSTPSEEHAAKHVEQAAAAVPELSASKDGKDSFQDTIRKTMERMQASGKQASEAATASNSEDDYLAEMMKALAAGGMGGEEDFNKMLMGMMSQLTNKEILYEPMKELHDKFPDWLQKNEKTTSAEDLTRFKEQQKLVGEIVGRFERKGYNDDNAEDREYIVDRMQKVRGRTSVDRALTRSDAIARLASTRPGGRYDSSTRSTERFRDWMSDAIAMLRIYRDTQCTAAMPIHVRERLIHTIMMCP